MGKGSPSGPWPSWRWWPLQDPPPWPPVMMAPPAGCRNGSRLVFGGYRGLRRRNSRSRFLSGSLGLYKRCWSREQVRGSPRRPRGRGRAQGVGRAPTLVGASGLFWPISDAPWASSGPKIISVKFQVNWTPFGFPFLRYSKTRKKQKLALGSRLIG